MVLQNGLSKLMTSMKRMEGLLAVLHCTLTFHAFQMYKVFDSLGNLMRKFSTYQAAVVYKMTFGNIYWIIK